MTEIFAAPGVIVRPGKLFASREPVWIRTLLGSCVSLCLVDRAAKVGGMNHFMLPGQGHPQDPMWPARYGIHAMELLINGIYKLGGHRGDLKALAFGGADVLPVTHSTLSVAQANVTFLREFLETEKIPLVKSLLGGVHPMRIAFLSTTGAVGVELVNRQQAPRIVATETRLLSNVVERSHAAPARQITIF